MWRNSLERYGGRLERCGGTVEHYGEQWNSIVEQGNSVMEKCGTAWLNSVAQCGGTVWNGMVK